MTPAADSHTILIVESLEGCGFRVVVAQDGEEGLQRADFVQPDLILLDVMMPGLDGFEVCRRLKALASTREIPVIFMTSLTETEHKITAFKAGGVDYVTKPLQIDEVKARVNTHLNLHAMQQRLEAQNAQLQQEIVERKQAEQALETSRELIRRQRRAEQSGGWATMPLPLVALAPPPSFRKTIGRMFFADRRSRPVHGFAAAGVRRDESSASAVSSQSAC